MAISKENTRVGFIGLGNMGFPMATNLLKAGWKLNVYDIDREKVQKLASTEGATAASSLAELGKNSDIVITILPDGHIVRRVALGKSDGDDCLAQGLAKGSLIIDMSSSAPVGTRELGKDLSERGLSLMDGPVSGGVRGAVAGTLAITKNRGQTPLSTKTGDRPRL